MNERVRAALPALACPRCHGVLIAGGEGIACGTCQEPLTQRGDAVFFLTSSDAHPTHTEGESFIVACKNTIKRFPRFYRVLAAVFGTSTGGVSPRAFLKTYVPQEDSLIINLGAGAEARLRQELHVDLFAFPGVDVVADMAQLPFRTGSVDAVMSIQVLEHVANPTAVMHEIVRVLKPGGVCYLTTPFLYPYHSSPHDYTRWTEQGLRHFVAPLTPVESGVRHGPTAGLAVIAAHWLALLLCFGSTRLFDLLRMGWMVLLAPIAHLFDVVLGRYTPATQLASGHYVVARKSTAASDTI